MPNPLINDAQNVNISGFPAGVNVQAIQSIMNMIQRGADIKDVIVAFKKNGITPDVAEMALCMAFPQLKEIRSQMSQMQTAGMSQGDMFAAFAKQANIAPSEVEKTYSSLMRLVK